MAFPNAWPPTNETTRKSLRFAKKIVSTPNWGDNAFLFTDQSTGNPMVSSGIAITNDALPGGVSIEFSFSAPDNSAGAAHVHGTVAPGEHRVYVGRIEAGIAVRNADGGVGSPAARIEAW
jgi:hypothetical protein